MAIPRTVYPAAAVRCRATGQDRRETRADANALCVRIHKSGGVVLRNPRA